MNVIESCQMTCPNGKTDECAKFVIADVNEVFLLSDVTVAGQNYVFSGYFSSDSDGSVTPSYFENSTGAESLGIGSGWTRVVIPFTATDTDFTIRFNEVGTYYIYHAQLETGNQATDWTPAPEDVNDSISDVGDTATEAKTAAENTENRIIEVEANVGALQGQVDGLTPLTNYLHVELEEEVPYMELGQRGSVFKVKITNTDIRFLEGTFVSAYISNKKLHIPNAVIEDELQIGGFVWTEHGSNGNVGLIWKKGGS